jgi:hypothetical protein
MTAAAICFLGSCIGISADIAIRRDGSGTISLEYRISRTLESLGKLGGNEAQPPVPVGRMDFERTAARIDGLHLRSFRSRTDKEDTVNTVQLDFADTGALVRFLDASGQRARLSRENGKQRLSLIMGGNSAGTDPDLRDLIAQAGEGYSVAIGFNLPGNAELTVLDGNGKPLAVPPAGTVRAQGRDLGFSIPLADFVSSPEPFTLEIRW